MINISLSFATTEEAVAFLSGRSPRAQATIAATEQVEKAQAAAPAPAPKAPKAKAEKAPAAPPAEQPKADAQTAAPAEVDYPTLQKAVFTLAGKDRGAVVEVLKTFGVSTAKDIPQDRWAEAHAAIVERTNAVA